MPAFHDAFHQDQGNPCYQGAGSRGTATANSTRLPPKRLGSAPFAVPAINGSAFHRKGGVGAFKEMVRALEENYYVALTADVPKRSRVAGLGIIMLARESGRPIMPLANCDQPFRPPQQLGWHHYQSAFGEE